MNCINYLGRPAIKAMLERAPHYQKTAETLLRLPNTSEINNELTTFVKEGRGIRKESSITILESHVIARNAVAIGKTRQGETVYNEWAIEPGTIINNYGLDAYEALTTDFKAFKKQATVQALMLTKELMRLLEIEGDELHIAVSWSPEPMIAVAGDYLTSGGYSISAHDMTDYALALDHSAE